MATVFTAQTKSAEAPDIEAALYDATFKGATPDIVKGGKFQKNPEGDPKLRWAFELLDDEGNTLYVEGEPVELEKLTGVGFNIAAKTTPAELRMLKALMTPAEYAAFEAQSEGVDVSDEGPLAGRKVQVEVFIKENGWPAIGNVIAARKARSSK